VGIRQQIEEHRDEADPRRINMLVGQFEDRVRELAHPDPYIGMCCFLCAEVLLIAILSSSSASAAAIISRHPVWCSLLSHTMET
jgi:hypothetical protein